MHFHYNNNLN